MAKTLDAAGVKRLIQEIKGANKNLNTPIPISTENTPESMAQNVKNIADYVAKAKAAGIANVNGMAVTCLIDNNYSGVGYIYGSSDDITVQGVLIKDDLAANECFSIFYTGKYSTVELITDAEEGKVTSSMLDKGARRPIILTPSTTEVDEETYQKLLSDDVDVVFYDATEVFNILYDRVISETTITLTFVSVTCSDTTDASSYVFSRFPIVIDKAAPHTLQVSGPAENNLEQILNDSNYLNKSTLTPVLQEIDLRGTDAERKAKLDQFETDWKALTGADDLTGARFVGKFGIIDNVERNVTGIMTYSAGDTATDATDNCFYGICNGYSLGEQKSQIAVTVSCTDGSLTITPLFSHLEAITIYTDNTPEHMQANLDNIAAYGDNLQALGVDTTGSFTIPFYKNDNQYPGTLVKVNSLDRYTGWLNLDNRLYPIVVTADGTYIETLTLTTDGSYSSLTTTSKHIVGAINEVNANAVHKDKLVPTLEAITIRTGNTPDDKAANVAAIKAYVDNLIALGVDVTKGYMIPCKFNNSRNGFIMQEVAGNYAGFIKNAGTYYGGGFVSVTTDGTYHPLEILSTAAYNFLTTNSKYVLNAINEVNALAKGYSTIFTPIELTTETAQNKTAIDARVAAFTAQGISLTNGCCIPVTYKGVYAGNISLINGDWYGLLVKNTNNPADNINIKLSADGTITEGNSVQ